MDYHIVIEEGPEGELISNVVELPGCFTQGNSVEELISRTKEAIGLYRESARKDESSKFVGLHTISLEDAD